LGERGKEQGENRREKRGKERKEERKKEAPTKGTALYEKKSCESSISDS